MKKEIRLFFVLVALLMLNMKGQAAEWQWSVEIPSMVSDETGGHPTAFLWIPEDCQRVKAVVVGQHNMCEETLFENVLFRQRMKEAGIALVWITPILNQPWDVATGCNDALLRALDDLAEVSGYGELGRVPIVPLGHSAMATYPWNFAAWNPERTLAVISYHGDAPRTNLCGYGRANLEWGRMRNIDGIPGLMIEGEYEWWEARVRPALAFRMMYPQSCISFLCDAGRGHFDVSDRTAAYIALFLKKVLAARLTETYLTADDAEEGKSVELKAVNPRDGWLAQRWVRGDGATGEMRNASSVTPPRRVKPAPYAQYKGDPHDAFWYFDREMAELTETIYRDEQNKEPSYVSFVQEGKLLSYDENAHVRITARFRPEADGLTFRMKAVHTDSTYRTIVEKAGVTQPKITRICGPVEQVDDTTFRVSFYRMGMYNRRRTTGITLLASFDGDKERKSAVQELSFDIPYRHTEGRRQHILFPDIPDVKLGTEIVKPEAVSDCVRPVSYYIKEGPAEVKNGQVVFTPIPPRTRFPVKVTVVAWQYGLDGVVQTAEPVERTFYIRP